VHNSIARRHLAWRWRQMPGHAVAPMSSSGDPSQRRLPGQVTARRAPHSRAMAASPHCGEEHRCWGSLALPVAIEGLPARASVPRETARDHRLLETSRQCRGPDPSFVNDDYARHEVGRTGHARSQRWSEPSVRAGQPGADQPQRVSPSLRTQARIVIPEATVVAPSRPGEHLRSVARAMRNRSRRAGLRLGGSR